MMNNLRMELKVCEACGALWLRALTVTCVAQGNRATAAAPDIYCKTCKPTLAGFAPVRTAQRRTTHLRVRQQRLAALSGGAR